TIKYLDLITVKTGYVYKIYETENIDFFRKDDGLLFLYTGGKKVTLDTPLAQLEKRLDPAIFFRAHRKAFVNLKQIKEIIPWGQGRYVLDFGDSGKVQVSRDSVKLLKQKIGLKI
ncbi:MAG: LytTR family transcriptional regulator, partial [Spirochaetales bacterium]|nr:LytTR family transcriptional regulator [Spirochaetales bacterium]